MLQVSRNGKRSEGTKPDELLKAIYAGGGMVGAILEQGSLDENAGAPISPVRNDCGQSSKVWAQHYWYTSHIVAGAAVPPSGPAA